MRPKSFYGVFSIRGFRYQPRVKFRIAHGRKLFAQKRVIVHRKNSDQLRSVAPLYLPSGTTGIDDHSCAFGTPMKRELSHSSRCPDFRGRLIFQGCMKIIF